MPYIPYRGSASDAYRLFLGRRGSGGSFPLERGAEPGMGPVEGDLDRIRPRPEHLGDLAGGEVGAVPEGHELTGALVEGEDGLLDGELADRLRLEVPRSADVLRQLRDRGPGGVDVVDRAAGDAEEPGDRLALAAVVPVPVSQ